jgi:signal transduction histidine kinase
MPDLAARVEAAFVAAWDRREDVLDELEALQAEAEATGTSREILRLTLASARLLRIAGRHDEATDRMDRVLAAWPGTDELPVRRMLLNYRGLIALDAGRLAEAVAPLLAAWRLAVEDDPASAAVAAMNLGMVLLELDDPSGAARWLDRATWPGQSAYSLAHVVFGRALVGRHTGDRAAVADAARTLQDLDLPEDPVGIRTVGLRHLVRGWQALDADDRDQAIASVEAALGCFVDGTSSEVVECRLLAARALASTDPTGALGHLRAVLDRGEPDGADRLHRMAADLHLALGDPAAAVPHLQRAAELARAPLRGLGRTLRRLLEQQEGRVHAVEAQLTVQNEALERANASLEVARAELERRVEVRTAALVEEVAVREAAEREASAASQAKTRFLATMSHELRTPLNAILGYTALLGEELQEEAHREDLRAIERAGGALLDLIEDLLDLTRAEAEAERLPMEAVDLQAVATEVVRKREGIRFDAGPVALVAGERVRLTSLVGHLVDHALGRSDVVSVRVEDHGDRVRLVVDDDGSAWSADQIARATDPFRHADPREAHGLGLGLAVARAHCEAMRGAFRVLNRPDGGLRAQVTLLRCHGGGPPAARG